MNDKGVTFFCTVSGCLLFFSFVFVKKEQLLFLCGVMHVTVLWGTCTGKFEAFGEGAPHLHETPKV